MTALLLAVLIVIETVLVAIGFHERGYRRGVDCGFRKGSEFGRREADNWWCGTDASVEEARQKIWKEEMER